MIAPHPPQRTRDWIYAAVLGVVLLYVVFGSAWGETAPLQPTPPVTTRPWYIVHHHEQRCIVATPALARVRFWHEEPAAFPPARAMAFFDDAGMPYAMDDVTEQGAIVQTTMHVFPTKEYPAGSWHRWYRDLARCEQAHHAEQRARERQRNTYR